MIPQIGILGGGAYGTALARAVARKSQQEGQHQGQSALLWSRRAREPEEGIRCTTELRELVKAELLFVAVPSTYVPQVARALGEHLDGRHLLVHVSRGLVGDDLETVGQHLSRVTAARRVGVLAGPLTPDVLCTGRPGGGIVGSTFPEVAAAVREAIGSHDLRLYETRDAIGVELASALVGLMALAAGFLRDVPSLGAPVLGLMLNRGMSEAARVAAALGAEPETFYGVAGYGDLIAAVAGDGRPEVALGQALARGASLADAGREAGATIEGVRIARRISNFAEREGIEAPISAVMASVLEGNISPERALARLMLRDLRQD